MTLGEALSWAQRQLSESGISTARLDALVLLEDCSRVDRAKILAMPDTELSDQIALHFKHQIRRRSEHIPLAYIRGRTEFFGRQFLIDECVLEPRPESEFLIEELLNLLKKSDEPIVIDIGTGSGALIITAKLEFPSIDAYAIDISQPALKLADKNANMHGCKVNFITSNLLVNLPHNKLTAETIIIANLPYVPDGWEINTAAMKEPSSAIYGGSDGLRLYARLFKQLGSLDIPPGYIITEAMPPQHDQLQAIASAAGYQEKARNDFIQVFNHYLEQRQA